MGPRSAVAAVTAALEVVDRREAEVRAWAYLDRSRALAEAASSPGGPLSGLVLGVKDVFDTADQPTQYGSPIYAGFRPRSDAAAVQLLRAAGAVCLGKTVTAELALFHPGPTTNPHRKTHTPGGSSMGSAAAVACGMADVALGTQTAGSVIRPASYCGVFGFKPTFGHVSTAGIKMVAPRLDTVGWFARSVSELDRVRVALTGRATSVALTRAPRILVMAPDAAASEAAQLGKGEGADVRTRPDPRWLAAVTEGQVVVHQYEAAQALAWEHLSCRSMLSPALAALLDQGAAIDPATYDAVVAATASVRGELGDVFADRDVLLTAAAGGEAPEGLASTGDPRHSRAWTLLGLPCLSVPGLSGPTGLPVGVQLVGRPGSDGLVLAVGDWLSTVLRQA